MDTLSTEHVEDLTTMPSLSLVDSPVSLPSSDGFVSIDSDESPVTVVERDEIPSASSAVSIQEADSVAILAKSMKSTTPTTRNEYKLDEESDWVHYQLHLLDRLWHNIQSEDVITLIQDEPEIGEVIESRRIMTFKEKRNCRLRYAMIPDGEAIKYMLNTVKTIVRQRRQSGAMSCTISSAIAAPPSSNATSPPLPTIVVTPPYMIVEEKNTFETCPPTPPTSLTSVQLPLIDEHVKEKMENMLEEVVTVIPSLVPSSSTPPCPPPLPLSVVQSMSKSVRSSLPSATTTTNDVKKPSFEDELANALKKRKEKVEIPVIVGNDAVEAVESVSTVISENFQNVKSEKTPLSIKKNDTVVTPPTIVSKEEETFPHSEISKISPPSTHSSPSSMEKPKKTTSPTVTMIGDISDMCPASWLPVEKVTPRPSASSTTPPSSRRLVDASTQTNSVVIFDVAPEHDYQGESLKLLGTIFTDVTTTTSEFHFDSVSQSVEKTRARRQAAFFPDITRALSNVQLTTSPVAMAAQQYSKMNNMYRQFN